MPIIRSHKSNSLTKMMRENYYGNDIVLKTTLEARADADLIAVAANENLIELKRKPDGVLAYYITPKGKDFVR